MIKSIIFTFTLSCIAFIATAQKGSSQNSVMENNPSSDSLINYRLFPTENFRIFIQLNTRNGKMWLVQFDNQDDSRFKTFLNPIPLTHEADEVANRFTLYTTQNMWTFILLDQVDGRTWQVQWSFEPENRFVIPIE